MIFDVLCLTSNVRNINKTNPLYLKHCKRNKYSGMCKTQKNKIYISFKTKIDCFIAGLKLVDIKQRTQKLHTIGQLLDKWPNESVLRGRLFKSTIFEESSILNEDTPLCILDKDVMVELIYWITNMNCLKCVDKEPIKTAYDIFMKSYNSTL